MLSTSQGHRLIMKKAFNLATQLLVSLMKIITSRGRCWVLSVTDYECLAFGNPHSQIGFSGKVTHSPTAIESLALFLLKVSFLNQFRLSNGCFWSPDYMKSKYDEFSFFPVGF